MVTAIRHGFRARFADLQLPFLLIGHGCRKQVFSDSTLMVGQRGIWQLKSLLGITFSYRS